MLNDDDDYDCCVPMVEVPWFKDLGRYLREWMIG